jgi:hypothetical protein
MTRLISAALDYIKCGCVVFPAKFAAKQKLVYATFLSDIVTVTKINEWCAFIERLIAALERGGPK